MKTPADGWDPEEREILDEIAAVRARHRDDPPLDLLRAADVDALPPDLQARVSDHLSGSEWSRALVAGAKAAAPPLDRDAENRLLARIIASAAQEPPRASKTRLWVPLLAAAAVMAIAAIVWPLRRASAPPAASASAAKPEATIARAEKPAYDLPLRKPEVKLSAAALTWRRPSDGRSLVDDLTPALDAFRHSDYARAAQALQPLERQFPAAIEPPFYRGISLLFLNDPGAAAAELLKAERLADSVFAPDVVWYLAVAEHRSGSTADARARLDRLCRTANSRAADACDAIKSLDASR